MGGRMRGQPSRSRRVPLTVTVGAAAAAAGVAVALLLPAELLAGGAGRLSIALLGAAAGVLAWRLGGARTAAAHARRDAGRTAAAARDARRAELLLAGLPDAVVAVDPRGVVRCANAAAGSLLGVRAEHVGRPYAESLSAPSLRAILTPVLDGAADHGGGDLADVTPGAVIQVRVRRVSGGDGDGWLALLCAADATRLRRLERLRHDFVANVSHELRTPITAIKGFVETMLDRRLYRGANGKRFLRITGAQAERLRALVEDLLSLSRIEQSDAGGIDAAPQPLAPIVRRAIDACQVRFGARRVRVDAAGVDGVRVRANAPLLERALVNLLENALLYGGDGVAVRVSARSGDGARIDVADDGPGIPDEHLSRLFERFYRVDRDARVPGSGLGLAIVKHVAQAHGGAVSVASEVGSGSTFTLRLPE